MYGMFALGKKQGVELGVAAGTVNALGSTIDKAGNSISKSSLISSFRVHKKQIFVLKFNLVNVGSDLKRGVMNVIYNDSDESGDEEYGEVNPMR